MRVLMITGHDVRGSLKEFSPLKNILLALGDKGHEVIFITWDKKNDRPPSRALPPVKYFHDNVKVKRFHIPGDTYVAPLLRKIPIVGSIWNRIKIEVIFPILAVWYGMKMSTRQRPDLLYGYEIFGAFPAYLLAKIFKVRLVLRYQGTFLGFWLHEAHKSLLGKWHLIRHYFHIFALKLPADLIVMTDDGTQGEAVVRELGNKSRLVFWRNGLDITQLVSENRTKEQLREELELPQKAKIMLSATRLVAWKRVDRIVNAIPFILKNIPDLLYVCIGDGEERRNLEACARALDVEHHIRFIGRVIHSQVTKFMHAADSFICMNDWSNVGNPTMEAMVCGLPVVTYDVGDTNRLIQDRRNGRLLTKTDPETVAQAVSELMNDDKLLAEYSQNAKQISKTALWTWAERISAEITELEQLAGCHKQSSD